MTAAMPDTAIAAPDPGLARAGRRLPRIGWARLSLPRLSLPRPVRSWSSSILLEASALVRPSGTASSASWARRVR